MQYEPNYEQRQAIESAVDSFIEQILRKIQEGEVSNLDETREALYECDWNECAAIGLSMEDEVDLIQQFGPDYDLDLGEVSLDDLRGKLEGLAVAVIHYVAEQKVAECLEELEEIMEEFELNLEDAKDSSPLGWMAHAAEREPAPNCTVHEYKNVEQEGVDIDVWEIRLPGGWKLYFQVSLAAEE